MTFSIKISLVGLSGSGKTTTLKSLCPDAFLMAEQQRMPTEVEAKAWKVSTNTPIPTSSVPNFAQLIFNNKYKIKKNYNGVIEEDDTICVLFDTCGQEIYYPITKSTTEGSNGILFIIDSTIPIPDQQDDLLRAYNDVKSFFPEGIPMGIILNKQDLVPEAKAINITKFIRTSLNSAVPELRKKSVYFRASALRNWGIEEAIEHIVLKIMFRVKKK